MSDTTQNTALKVLTVTEHVKTIKENMADRQLFPTLAEALAKLEAVAVATLPKKDDGTPDTDAVPFFGLPVAIKGQKDDGSIDESIYEGRDAGLVYVGAKLKEATGIKGIAIIPFPRVEEFAATDAGKGFIARVVEKEVALVAFRSFRDSTSTYEFTSGVNGAPTTAEDFTTVASRGLNTETFDKIWKPFRDALKDRSEALWKLLPLKNEFRDAMRSKAFALENPKTAAFEEQGLIVGLARVLIDTAKTWQENGKPAPLDTGVMESWLAGRDEFVIERETEERDYSVLASLAESLSF